MARLGYLAISTAAVLWAVGATVASRLLDRGASTVELTAARAWLGAVGMAVIILASRRRRRGEGLGLVAAIPFGLALAAVNFCYYFAISRLPVAIAIVVQYTAPGFVVLWVAAAEGSKPSARVLGALALAFGGVALLAEVPTLIARGELTLDGLGLLAAIGSAVAFASYMLLGESLGRRFRAEGALLRGFIVSSIFWAVAVAARGRPDTLLDTSFTAGIVFVALGATLAPFLLFLWGIGHVGAARAGIVSTLEPLVAALLAYAWLDQTLTGWQLAGGAMVLAGIGVVQSERPRAPEVLAEAAAVE